MKKQTAKHKLKTSKFRHHQCVIFSLTALNIHNEEYLLFQQLKNFEHLINVLKQQPETQQDWNEKKPQNSKNEKTKKHQFLLSFIIFTSSLCGRKYLGLRLGLKKGVSD